MNNITLIGIDLGKQGFRLHAQESTGRRVFRKKLSRAQLRKTLATVPACRLAMEACAGAHWLARQLTRLGHEVKLISPQFVKPFVQGNKNDFADAQAIGEAASRPSMRFVSPRNETQQTGSALHRLREGLVRDRTATTNQIHAFLLEFGISLPKGSAIIKRLPTVLAEQTAALPPRLIAIVERLRTHFQSLDEPIRPVEQEIVQQLQEDERSQRLLDIPLLDESRTWQSSKSPQRENAVFYVRFVARSLSR